MEQHNAQPQPADHADVFDMEARHDKQEGHATSPTSDKRFEKTAKKGAALLDRLANMSAGNLAAITVAVICIGLVIPRLTAHAPAQPSGSDQLLTAPGYIPLPKQPASEQPDPLLQHASNPKPVPASTAPEPQASGPANDTERAIIRAALEDLNTRLARLEAAQPASNTTIIPVPPASIHPVPATPAARPHRPAVREPALPVLHGYALNTIYRNQAWIEHDGTTYAVQVGDRIGSLAITAIDAGERRVTTTAGQIR